MTARVFSPWRVIAIVALSFVSVWYFGVMARNSTPRGRDLQRQEQPLGRCFPAVEVCGP